MKKSLLFILGCMLMTILPMRAADEFTLVKSMNDITADGTYVLWGSNNYSGQQRPGVMGSGAITTGYIPGYMLAAGASTLNVYDNITIDDPSKAAYIKFETVGEKMYIKIVTGTNKDKYIKSGTSNNSISVQAATKDATALDATGFKINATTGKATIKFDGITRYLTYNATAANAARVSNYGNTTTGSAYLYKLKENGPQDVNAVFENIVCKKGDVRNIVYTPTDLGAIEYTLSEEGIISIADGKVTALKVGGPVTVTAKWGTGTKYKEGTATFTVTVEGNVSTPVIAPEAAEILVTDKISITTTDGAELSYAYVAQGEAEPTEYVSYTEPFALKAGAWTVYASAVLDGESAITSKNYTVSKLEAGLEYPEREFVAYISEGFTAPKIVNPNNLPLTYSSNNNDVAAVDPETGEVTLSGVQGKAQIMAKFKGDDTYKASQRTYNITVLAERPKEYTYDFTTDAPDGNAVGGKGAYGMTVYGDSNGTINNVPVYETEVKTIPEGDITLSFTGDYRIWKATDNTNHLRMQGGSTFTLTAKPGYVITSVEIEASSNANSLSADPGTYTSDRQGNVWAPANEIGNNSIEFTRTGTSGNTRIQKIKVTWSEYPAPAAPEVSINDGVVSGENIELEEGATEFKLSFGEVAEGIEVYYNWAETTPEVTLAATEEGFVKYNEPVTLSGNKGMLQYYAYDPSLGLRSDIKKVNVSVPVGIEGIEGAESAAEYYDLEGRRVKGELQKGIYLRKVAGKVEKVVVR